MKSVISIIVLVAVALAAFYLITTKKNSKSMTSTESFKQQYKETPGIVIDVRTQGEYDNGHLKITDQHHDILNGDFAQQLDSLDKNETYYLYCRSGNRSGKATQMMKDKGFEKVYNIGGYQDLVNSGLESE
ncbi:MAG: rhodanese [Balneola sp.]|jgi:phage shock protein E|nr:rhodanese [Balneola sp.]MBE78544.1 rhodanese [Balneola sp.]|tara:strand:- start:818 stop:1210 length:393 start_codon:yes stop_codon:yes gene_type:complete